MAEEYEEDGAVADDLAEGPPVQVAPGYGPLPHVGVRSHELFDTEAGSIRRDSPTYFFAFSRISSERARIFCMEDFIRAQPYQCM